MSSAHTARRYVAWLERRARLIFAATLVVGVCSVYGIAFQLPVYTDLSHLLPQDAPAVRALRVIEHRLASRDTTSVLVVAPGPQQRATATKDLIERVAALPGWLVHRIETDDLATRDFLHAHRHLFVPVETLREVRATLARRIEQAKLAANPLFVDLGDEPGDEQSGEQLDEWRRRAKARLDRSSNVSADGRSALISVETGFGAADLRRGRAFVPTLEQVAHDVERAHPGVSVGIAGGIPTAVAEHAAIVRGIVWSSILTAILVGIVLLLLLRSVRLLALVTVNIVVATVVSFGIAVLTVGQLNSATAFLGAIIGGNGINFGVVLIARYLEERRQLAPNEAMAIAIAATVRPTLVSATGASICYAALMATSFRGFADFGRIGGVGMVVCWISSYVLLPVLVLRFAHRVRTRAQDPVFARLAGRLHVRRPAVACTVAAVATVAATLVAWRFIANDPFEYDMTRLRSDSSDALETRAWMKIADEEFGHGLWSKVYALVDRPDQVAPIIARVRALQATPAGQATIGSTFSILDVVPPDQPRKLELLADVRRLLADPAIANLAPADADAELEDVRPPADLRAITPAELPEELRRKLTERDGRIGTLIAIKPPAGYDELDGRNLLRLASVVEQLRRDAPEAVVAGASLIFADIMRAMRSDAAITTGLAAVGILVIVVVIIGRNRRTVAVLGSMVAGTLGMIALCALLGLRINFLDFIAVPITLGLGVDYAVNLAQRAESTDPRVTLRTTGSAVVVCSLTTIIGYASLLLSENVALRAFGTASLIGEGTSLMAALWVVPGIMGLGRRHALGVVDSQNGLDHAASPSACSIRT